MTYELRNMTYKLRNMTYGWKDKKIKLKQLKKQEEQHDITCVDEERWPNIKLRHTSQKYCNCNHLTQRISHVHKHDLSIQKHDLWI